MLHFNPHALNSSRPIDPLTGQPVAPKNDTPPPGRVGPGIRLEDALEQMARQEQRAANTLLDEAAAWARGRSQTKAILELYAELLAMKAIIKSLEARLNGTD